MSWSTPLEQPIKLPDGGELVTLQDAATYIQRLPREIHDRPEWQLAVHQLIEAAEGRSFLMFARIAVLRAMNDLSRGAAVTLPEPRHRPVKHYRIIQ